jgi:hypothetical protein
MRSRWGYFAASDFRSAANASLDPVEDTPAETISNPKRRTPSIKRVDSKPRPDRKTRSEAGKRELVAISRARTPKARHVNKRVTAGPPMGRFVREHPTLEELLDEWD